MKFFFLGKERGAGVILGENVSRSGEGMSKFLASGDGGGYVRHSRHVRSYQNMFKN